MWQRYAMYEKSQREEAVEGLRRLEQARLDNQADKWRLDNMLIKCLVGWHAVARTERAKRLRNESRSARRNRINALLHRAFTKRKDEINEEDSEINSVAAAKKSLRDRRHADEESDEIMVALKCIVGEYLSLKGNDEEGNVKNEEPVKQSNLSGAECGHKKAIKVIDQQQDSDKENIEVKTKQKLSILSTPSREGNCGNEKNNIDVTNRRHQYTINMEQRRKERASRRKALHDRYINAQKKREEDASNAAARREEEQQRIVRIEKEGRENAENEKRLLIDKRREAWRMAKLHFKLILLRRSIGCWKNLSEEATWKDQKVCFLNVHNHRFYTLSCYPRAYNRYN